MSVRHGIANALYALAEAVDSTSGSPNLSGDGLTFGDDPYESVPVEYTVASVNIHLRDGAPIGASFKPGKYTYAALHVGRGFTATIFLSRRTTRKFIDTLQFIERQFAKYGEGNIR